MPLDYNKTTTLLAAIDRQYVPNTLLIDTFFPGENTFITESVQIEYRKGTRLVAPFIVPGAFGVNMARTGSKLREYTPPMMAPSRVISTKEIMQRTFGEDIYSQKTPAQRAAEIMARDLLDTIDMCTRRQELMAAQLLTTGQYTCEGYADDGNKVIVDTFVLDGFENKVTLSGNDTWDNPDAKILDDLTEMSDKISTASGIIPTVGITSRNVANYILNNKQILDIMMVPSRENLSILSFAPAIVSPYVTRLGYIQSLNLDLYVYNGTYADPKTGKATHYIPDNCFIMGVKGLGKRLYGAITQLESDDQFHTYEGKYVPKILSNKRSDTKEMRMGSRCVILPQTADDFGVIKVK